MTNPARAEAAIAGFTLRPSFAALVAAEQELGPLFSLVERAAAGQLGLAETIALLWPMCTNQPDGLTRDDFAEALMAAGLAALAPVLRTILGQILKGR
ncbi:MAG: GTA-gp10 family protein [Sphingopyxis sp.]